MCSEYVWFLLDCDVYVATYLRGVVSSDSKRSWICSSVSRPHCVSFSQRRSHSFLRKLFVEPLINSLVRSLGSLIRKSLPDRAGFVHSSKILLIFQHETRSSSFWVCPICIGFTYLKFSQWGMLYVVLCLVLSPPVRINYLWASSAPVKTWRRPVSARKWGRKLALKKGN